MVIKESAISLDTAWRERAACLDYPAILFFGIDDAETPAERRLREDEAKQVCFTCPVREECLDYALVTKEAYGIWGGLTEIERRSRVHTRRN